jgi:hypothetical protein
MNICNRCLKGHSSDKAVRLRYKTEGIPACEVDPDSGELPGYYEPEPYRHPPLTEFQHVVRMMPDSNNDKVTHHTTSLFQPIIVERCADLLKTDGDPELNVRCLFAE